MRLWYIPPANGAVSNAHIRRVIVESAWYYRRPPAVGISLNKRQEGQSEEIKAISWRAQHRLNLKFGRLTGRNKSSQIAAVAVCAGVIGFHVGDSSRNKVEK